MGIWESFYEKAQGIFGNKDGKPEAKGFYAVYGELFHNLAAEEYAYIEDFEERNFPVFGKKDSDYGLIVNQFYGFWKDFSTRRSFAWLDKYDLRQAEDGRTAKLMQKENQKFRDEGKKQRTNQIRELVSHIRALDERVKKNRDYLEKKAKEQFEKAEKQRKLDIQKNLEELSLNKYEMNEEEREEHLKNLREIEEALDAQFGTTSADVAENSDSEMEDEDSFYCIICEKGYKNAKAYANHQKSKKHKLMVEEVRKHMKEEDKQLFDNSEDHEDDNEELAHRPTNKRAKKKRAKNANTENKESDTNLLIETPEVLVTDIPVPLESTTNEEEIIQPKTKNFNGKSMFLTQPSYYKLAKTRGKTAQTTQKEMNTGPKEPIQSQCQICKEEFESRSKLFKHIDLSGHAALKTGNEKLGVKGGKKKKI